MLPSKVLHYLVDSVMTFVADRAFAERVAEFHGEHPVESGPAPGRRSRVERMLDGVAFAPRVQPGLATQLAR